MVRGNARIYFQYISLSFKPASAACAILAPSFNVITHTNQTFRLMYAINALVLCMQSLLIAFTVSEAPTVGNLLL